jgi:alkylated DNA repair dioxygenase AlkB
MIGTMVQDVNGIRGLTCVRDYISAAEEADLLDMIDARPWLRVQKRAVQAYGAGTSVRLPGWLLALADRLAYDGFAPADYDQCVVDEFLPGQGMSAHVDSVLGIGATVAVLGLGAPLVMEFRHTNARVRLPVLVPPRSLLLMTDAARYKWRHGVAARKRDQYDGVDIPRGRHVSISFRQALVDMTAEQSVKYA